MWTTWLQRLGITFSISLLMACGGGGDDPEPNVVEVAQRDANFSILAEAVVAADLADKPLLTKVLTYHALAGRVPKADVPAGPALTTVQGNTFTVDAALAINDRSGRKAAITTTDVLARNGVIHVIDTVILPTL